MKEKVVNYVIVDIRKVYQKEPDATISAFNEPLPAAAMTEAPSAPSLSVPPTPKPRKNVGNSSGGGTATTSGALPLGPPKLEPHSNPAGGGLGGPSALQPASTSSHSQPKLLPPPPQPVQLGTSSSGPGMNQPAPKPEAAAAASLPSASAMTARGSLTQQYVTSSSQGLKLAARSAGSTVVAPHCSNGRPGVMQPRRVEQVPQAPPHSQLTQSQQGPGTASPQFKIVSIVIRSSIQ